MGNRTCRTDASTNESGFKVERATQTGGPFTQIGLTGANITTFSDSALSTQTTYYYEVLATNNVGDSSASNVSGATTFSPYTPTGLVAYWTVVRAGSRNEIEPGKSGFAHLFEHMMFRGTEAYPKEKYNAVLKQLGADHNAFTTDDYTAYHVLAPASGLEALAYSRFGMRPARNALRPAITPSRMASAINTGFLACAMAVFSKMP